MRGDKGQKRERFVDRLRWWLAGLAAPAHLAILRRDRFFCRGGDRAFDTLFPLLLSLRVLGRQVETGHVLALRLLDGVTGFRAPDRRSRREDPAHTGDRFAADQPALIEEPGMFGMELLERIVRQDRPCGLVRDAQEEGVAPPDRTGRRRDDLAGGLGLVEGLPLAGIDAMAERGIDHSRDDVVRILGDELPDSLIELRQAGGGTPLGRQVAPVDDNVPWCHGNLKSSRWRVL